MAWLLPTSLCICIVIINAQLTAFSGDELCDDSDICTLVYRGPGVYTPTMYHDRYIISEQFAETASFNFCNNKSNSTEIELQDWIINCSHIICGCVKVVGSEKTCCSTDTKLTTVTADTAKPTQTSHGTGTKSTAVGTGTKSTTVTAGTTQTTHGTGTKSTAVGTGTNSTTVTAGTTQTTHDKTFNEVLLNAIIGTGVTAGTSVFLMVLILILFRRKIKKIKFGNASFLLNSTVSTRTENDIENVSVIEDVAVETIDQERNVVAAVATVENVTVDEDVAVVSINEEGNVVAAVASDEVTAVVETETKTISQRTRSKKQK
ncbi:mucin-22-like isoform X2 [Mya arenaria]|uniref:mucin-22-like isoform X2 n=1 Tax=Mya arenaria TaxID=6604 RepID=UPI0022E48416|nr:mucin-22-like isoform X2 [Mya arenaria]